MTEASERFESPAEPDVSKATEAEESVRLRVRVLYEYEYDADPAHYGTNNPVEMARIDAEGLGGDPLSMLGSIDPKEIVVEALDGRSA
jgi:hypothetical protein